MHVPDGFLSAPVWAGAGVLSLAGLALAARAAQRTMREAQVPLLGVAGAFVFSAQMINVPVGAGTSGHLVGATLLAVLLGPHLAAIAMTCVVLVQALLFQDGGLTAIGANLLGMALVGPYLSAAALGAGRRLPRTIALFAAAWVSVVAMAALVALMLALSGTIALLPALVAMTGVHAVVGALEGAITVAVVRFLLRVRPDLVAA